MTTDLTRLGNGVVSARYTACGCDDCEAILANAFAALVLPQFTPADELNIELRAGLPPFTVEQRRKLHKAAKKKDR